MTDPVSISNRILSSLKNSIPTKPSTTISTIVVQSSETRVVIALLKSDKNLEFRILEMNPKWTSLGYDVNESEQMLNDHEDVIAKLEKKHTPVEDFIRQVDALTSIENPDVYVAMGKCLEEAWNDLNNKLGIRKEILILGYTFHGYRLMCLDSFRKYDNSTRKETLINYSNAVDRGSQLQDKLKTLEESWESILQVNYWLDDLRQAMLEWKTELQKQESKEKESKIYDEYLDVLIQIKNRKDEYALTRTELLSMFTKIDNEYKLTPTKKKELNLKVYEVLQYITDKIETIENVKLFLNENNKLDEHNFTEDYLEKLKLVKDLDEILCDKIKKRLDIRQEYENILEKISENDYLDEQSIKNKLSEDETLDITNALENIKRKFYRDKLGIYELFKERIQIIEASIKEGGELQDYLLLNDIVDEVEVDLTNAKKFDKKDEIFQKCKNLNAIIQHRISILQDVKQFINQNKDLSDDSFRAEHIKTLRRLTDSKDGRILSCILRNRLTVRNVYELILKSPLDYEEEEITELISVDQTLETQPAIEKIMARRRLLELLKTLDFPLPENLTIAKSDLVDFEAFEDMVASLPDAPEELIQKTNAKKTKILKCIHFYELLEQHDKPDQLEMLAALENELFGTTHWNDLIPNKIVDDTKKDNIREVLQSEMLTAPEPSNIRDSSTSEETNDSSSQSVITSLEVMTDGEITLEEERISSATPSLNLTISEKTESEAEHDRYGTPISEVENNTASVIKLDESLKPEKESLGLPKKIKEKSPEITLVEVKSIEVSEQIFTPSQTKLLEDLEEQQNVENQMSGKLIAVIRVVSRNQDGGDTVASPEVLGSIQLETVHSKESSDPTINEILKPIQQTHLEVEVLRIIETPVELQNIGMETQIVQEPPELDNVESITFNEIHDRSNKEGSETQISEVPQELTSIGMQTQIVEEPQEIQNFVITEIVESPEQLYEETIEQLTSTKTQEHENKVLNKQVEIKTRGAIIVEEPLELENIGKQTVIIEEPGIIFTEIEDNVFESDVKILSEKINEEVLKPKSITLVETVIQTKTPQGLENDKVESLLTELEEIKNLNTEKFLIPLKNENLLVDPDTLPISKINTTKQPSLDTVENTVQLPRKLEKAKEELYSNENKKQSIQEVNPNEYKTQTERTEINNMSGETKPENINISIKSENNESPITLADTSSKESSFESISIPVEVTTSDQSDSPNLINTIKLNELNQFEINSLEIFKKPDDERNTQYPIILDENQHYVNDIIVETETLEFETAVKLTIENKIPPKQNTVETQTNEIDVRPKQATVEIQTLDDYQLEIKPFIPDSFGIEHIGPEFKQISTETQTLNTPIDEYPTELSTPSTLRETVLPGLVLLNLSKPLPNERPAGLELSTIPRKSAFVHTKNFAPRNISIESQTSPVVELQSILRNNVNQTPNSKIYKIESVENEPMIQTTSCETQTVVTTIGSEPLTNKFATGMAEELLSEVRYEFEAALERVFRNSISPPMTSHTVEHPVGLLQIIEAESPISPTCCESYPPIRSDPSNVREEYKSLEGYKSPVQEMETQTLQPPPVLNSETQTVEFLKRLDSSYTQTVHGEVKTLNIQTQTDVPYSFNSFSEESRSDKKENPINNVNTEINYFIPNVFQEVLGNGKSPTVDPHHIEKEKIFSGTSEKVRHFENVSQTTNSLTQNISSQSIQKETFIPITSALNLEKTNAENKNEKHIPIKLTSENIIETKSKSDVQPQGVTRVIKIETSPVEIEERSPLISPYSIFTESKSSPKGLTEIRSPKHETRILNVQLPQRQTPQESLNWTITSKPHEVVIKIQQEPELGNYPGHTESKDDIATLPLHPWRTAPTDGIKNSDGTIKNETVAYTFGHFEETKETLLPEKQTSVRDRVKYWEPKLILTDLGTEDSQKMDSKLDEKTTTPGNISDRVPVVHLTEESVANIIEERRKELAEYQQRGKVSEYKKLFQSFEKTTSASGSGFQEPQGNVYNYTETFQKTPSSPLKDVIKLKEPNMRRRHSETISTSCTQSAKSEEIPQEGTVARFKRLFQSYEVSDNRQDSCTKRSEYRNSRLLGQTVSQDQSELVTSPPGFRTYERFISPAFPKRECTPHEETQQIHNVCSSEWKTFVNKTKQNSSGERSTTTTTEALSPTLRPTKFVPGDFHESDYESDYECKILPIWVPPSSSRPSSSLEFRPITPIVHLSEHKQTPTSAFIPVREIPIKSTQNTQLFTKSVVKTKPIPPPKPMLRNTNNTTKETFLTSKVTKTEETKYTFSRIKSPQPDSGDDLSLRTNVPSLTSLVSPDSPVPIWNQPPRTTTRIFKSEEFVEKHTK